MVNAISQYLRTGICMVLSLYSTRLILAALGQSDFGIYALIGSVVMMLSFITSSLATSTQRFLSYSWGKNDISEIKIIFSNAFVLHLLISIVLAIVLVAGEHTIVHDYMRISADRMEATDFVYYTIVIILILTFMTAPLRALFIARENIVYASCVDITDSLMKFFGAVMLTYINYDMLKTYALLMVFISALTFFAFGIYAAIKYEECHVPRISELSLNNIKRISSFATWTVYAVGSTIVRTQGLAVILNKFLGTVINAAYGLALQVLGAASAIAASILNAMNPQLMKAEGGGDRTTMLKYATKESKYSLLILSCVMIPVIIEMPGILTVWLKEYPTYTVEFCRMLIIATVIDQATIGLTSANQAGGNIRNYSLITSTIRLTTLPLAWLCFYEGLGIIWFIGCYIVIDMLCGLSRIPLIKYTAGLDVAYYCRDVFLRPLCPIVGNIIVSIGMTQLIDGSWRFIITECVGILVTAMLIYVSSLDASEKRWVREYIIHRRHD